MGGCSVLGCTNSTSKGFRLFKLPQGPRNAERRQLWLQFISRSDLSERASIGVCEDHFEDDQYENRRQDNRKLLKWNAVPTIVSTTVPKSSPSYIRSDCQNPVDSIESIESLLDEDLPSPIQIIIESENLNDESLTGCNENEEEEDITNLNTESLRDKLQEAYSKIRLLESKVESIEKNCREIFSADQVDVIINGSPEGVRWSDETVKKSLKLYMACGRKAYKELRKQKLPYPSIRALQQRICSFRKRS